MLAVPWPDGLTWRPRPLWQGRCPVPPEEFAEFSTIVKPYLLTLFSLEAVFFFSSINTKKWYFGSSLSDGHSFFPFVGSKNGWWIPPNFSLFSASLSMVD